MDDPIIQVEVALNFVNSLLAKAVYFKDDDFRKELSGIRHSIYYDGDFNHESIIKKLQDISKILDEKYE